MRRACAALAVALVLGACASDDAGDAAPEGDDAETVVGEAEWACIGTPSDLAELSQVI